MIAYAVILLTPIENIHEAQRVLVRYGTTRYSICGEVVRAFVMSTNHAYHDFPYTDCLAHGLTLVPPEMRPIFEYLYETLKEVFVWQV